MAADDTATTPHGSAAPTGSKRGDTCHDRDESVVVELRAWLRPQGRRPALPRSPAEPRTARPQPAPAQPAPLLRTLYGEILRDERRDQDRTLAEVASRVGMSKQYLSEVERGRKEPSSEMLSSVCDALGLPVEDLLTRGARKLGAQRRLDRHPTPGSGVTLRAA